jgi:hypothetical protein
MTVYNEIHDETGAKRPAYAALDARTSRSVADPPVEVVAPLGRKGIVGSEGIHPVPLVLDEAEYHDVLVPGVRQRAFALQELFADIALGAGTIVASGLLSSDDLEHILRSEGVDLGTVRRLWRGQERDQIRFVYGPDMVRDDGGRWQVLEDNVGCVGGVADGRAVLQAYLETTGVRPASELAPASDLDRAVRAFLDRVGLALGVPGLYGIPGTPSSSPLYDFETVWKGEALRSLGVEVASAEALLDRLARGGTRCSALINLGATLARSYRRLAEVAFADRAVPTFGPPCVGLIASKSFHALGEALVALYLDQPLLLKTPPTQLLRDLPTALPERGVLKRSNGCEGTEVFFLDQLTEPATERALLDALATWGPCGAIIQAPVARSVLAPPGTPLETAPSVELRPIVYVLGWRTALVGEIVTARAVQPGRRRGNISRGARFLPVLREPVPAALRSARSP